MVQNSPAYQTLALGRLLAREAFGAALEDPGEAVRLAQRGLSLLTALSAERYDSALIQDATASALAALGNAYRLASDFAAGAAALKSARRALSEGTCDPLDETRVDVLEARLLEKVQSNPAIRFQPT